MSAIYNLEPQPTASAIIHTTQGDVHVELFAKQTPLTSRNFLQLALDGYYDNTIFHRLVPGFILQGGDPTGTGEGGESIYDRGAFSGDLDPWPMDLRKGKNAGPAGVNFKDEFHSRLKFNRRGLLGMANEGQPDTNGSQFFFTLGKTEELTGKNTLFGRVVGDSIYNLAKMGEAEVEEDGERPLYPVKITSIEILVNPFEDMKKRERVAHIATHAPKPSEKKPKKRKGGKQLLSFGDEEGDVLEEPVLKKAKFDTRIVVDDGEQAVPLRSKSKKQATAAKGAKAPDESVTARTVPVPEPSRSRAEPKTAKPASPHTFAEESTLVSRPDVSDSEEELPKKSLLEKTNEEIAALKAAMRRTTNTEPIREKKKTALEQLIPETSVRGRKRKPGGNTAAKDAVDALRMLQEFQSKLKQVPEVKIGTDGTVGAAQDDSINMPKADERHEEDAEVCDLHFIANCQSCRSWDKKAEEESDDEGWMAHTLSFAADKLGKDLNYRKKAEEELVVIDPLQKARTLQEDKKVARATKSASSNMAWDQARPGRGGAR